MDYIIPLLSESEEKVLVYVLRRTYGFRDREGNQKEQDYISYSQFIGGQVAHDGTLLNFGAGVSRSKLSEALAFHQSIGLIERLDPLAGKAHAGRGSRGLYRLNRDCEIVQFLNHCLQDPDSARERMVQYLNQKRRMVQKVNHNIVKLKNDADLGKNGSESEPLKNGSESEPEMVQKVNQQNKRKKEKKETTTPEKAIAFSTPAPESEYAPDDMQHTWAKGSKRVPIDFPRLPTDAMHAWAVEHTPHVDVLFEHGAFIDYTFPKPHTDWYAAWRGWMRRAERDAKKELARIEARASPRAKFASSPEADERLRKKLQEIDEKGGGW